MNTSSDSPQERVSYRSRRIQAQAKIQNYAQEAEDSDNNDEDEQDEVEVNEESSYLRGLSSPSSLRKLPSNTKLGEKLGSGAHSTVYKGLNVANGNFVAIKRIKRKKVSEEQLLQEIDLLKQCDHENIGRYIDLIVTEHHINLILEYIESGSLSQVIEKFGVFPESLVSIYMGQVLKGLEYLHSKGVTHRDIKGPNILITKEGIVKLADFGIALPPNGVPAAVDGSPFWMAPEVIQQSANASTSCDIWSLGCTIIELLTGFPPYYDCSAVTALYHMVDDPHPPFPDDISKDLNSFLLLCFCKDPVERPSATKLLSHPWITKAMKAEKESWTNTIKRVRKYNSKKRKATLQRLSLLSQEWVRNAVTAAREEAAAAAANGNTTDSNVNSSSSTKETPDTVTSSVAPPHKRSTDSFRSTLRSSNPKDDIEYVAVITGTETRKNFLFSYTVYRVKVCITYPKECATCYVVYRSYSDFRELDNKLRSLLARELPEFPAQRFFSNTEPDYVNLISEQLSDWLAKILSIPTVSQTKVLAAFLRDDGSGTLEVRW